MKKYPAVTALRLHEVPRLVNRAHSEVRLHAADSNVILNKSEMRSAQHHFVDAKKRTHVSSLVAVVDRYRCIGCDICEEICPTGAISVSETAKVDTTKCTGCGECAADCPQEAISLQIIGEE